MLKRFKFTDNAIKALPANSRESKSTELEVSNSEVQGLKCLIGKAGNKRFLFCYTYHRRKQSISLGRFGDINVATARKYAQEHYLNLLHEIRDDTEFEF